MNTLRTLVAVAAAAACALAAAPAAAITYNGAVTQNGTTVTDYSSTGLISFDLDLKSFASATLSYTVSADDLSMPLDFSAILRNLSGAGVPGYAVSLNKGVFDVVGSVTRQFGGTTAVTAAGGTATLAFSSLEFLDVEVGNALGTTPAALDWTIGGLQAGDTLSLTVSVVPEPGGMSLLLSGVLAVAWVARRRQG